MKLKLIIAGLLLGLLAEAQPVVDWYNYPGGVCVATDTLNNVFTANWDYNPAGDITLTKRNSSGAVLWNAAYNNTDATRHEVATWVETDHAGNILVAGTIRSGYSNPVNAASLLMKYNTSGVLLWRVVYESSFDGSYTRKCLVDGNNNIYVLGLGTGPNGQVTKVKKFNAAGTAVWSWFDNAGIGAPINFKFTPDNKILISARGITGSINGYAKIDWNGNLIWGMGGVNSLTVGDAAGDASGNTYLINGEYVVTNPGSVLRKLSPSGTTLWTDTNNMTGYRVEVGNDNKPVISGFPSSGSSGAAFMKFDGNGNMEWQNLDADGPSFALLMHAQMKLDASNAAYLAAGTLFEMAICKVNSNGTSAWTATAPGSYANTFSIGADNNVYVTGGTTARIVQAVTPTCQVPAGLNHTGLSPSQVRVKWTPVPGAIQYEVWYKKTTAVKWKKKFVQGIYKSTVLNNLICNTAYDWKVRTVCDTVGVDITSAFASTANFSTGNCRIESQDHATKKTKLKVYPTLVSDFFNMELQRYENTNSISVSITDATGRHVYHETYTQDNETPKRIHTGDLKPGIYFVIVQTQEEIFTQRILKQQ